MIFTVFRENNWMKIILIDSAFFLTSYKSKKHKIKYAIRNH